MTDIADIRAREILDSRGNPTVEVEVMLDSGAVGRAAVPSGASTGAHEAVEMRDGDPKRYGGKRRARGGRRGQRRDLRRAQRHRRRRPAPDRPHADRTRRHAEQGQARRQRHARGQPGLREGGGDRLGPAALPLRRRRLRAHPAGADDEHRQWRRARRQPDRHPGIHDHAGRRAELRRRGAHGRPKFSMRCAASCTMPGTTPMSATRAGSRRTSLRPTRRCRLSCRRSRAAGYQPGEEVALALDPASTEFFRDGKYRLEGEGKVLDRRRHGRLLRGSGRRATRSCRSRTAWPRTIGRAGALLTDELGDRVQLVGDDALRDQPEAARATASRRASATRSWSRSTRSAPCPKPWRRSRWRTRAGYGAVMSHRSGETEDTTIADLAVATNCGQIKTGSLSRSDRLAEIQPADPHRGRARRIGALSGPLRAARLKGKAAPLQPISTGSSLRRETRALESRVSGTLPRSNTEPDDR